MRHLLVRLRTWRGRFGFGFEVSWAKLVTARAILFGLLAIDALLQIRNAPRYGAGGFNVAQLPGLDWMGPSRAVFELAELANAYLFVLIACGIAIRWLVPIAAVIYSWLCVGSPLDSSQHHYLIAPVLVLACFVPWGRPERAMPATKIRAWALQLILIQLVIVYVWAAISKIDATIGIAMTPKLVLMIGIYAVVIPDRIYLALAESAPMTAIREGLHSFGARFDGRASWATFGFGVVLGLGMAIVCRFEGAARAGIVATVAIVAGVLVSRTAQRGGQLAWLGIVQALALATWFTVDRETTIAADYYKLWGDTSHRLKDTETAERAYLSLVRIAPADPTGHFLLGRIWIDRGAVADGLAQLHDAEAHDGAQTRAYLYEARWLAAHGRTSAAIAKAREAATVAPNDADTQSLLGLLTGAPP